MYNAVDLEIKVDENGNVNLSLGNYDHNGLPNAPIARSMEETIKPYVDMFNLSDMAKFDNLLLYRKPCTCKVYLCFYDENYLNSPNLHGVRIIKDEKQEPKWQEFNSFSEYDTSNNSNIIHKEPTIHLTNEDIFTSNDSNSKEIEPNKRYARFMDSSIWNYYVPILVANENKIDVPDRYDFSPLKHALLEILNNHFYTIQGNVYNLYELSVAREYANLFSRIVNQSFLPEISGHSENVSPYLFHSERKSSKDLNKKEHTDVLSKIKQYKWRFLLVDDHSNVPMSSAVKGENKETLKKLDVVKAELEKLFKNIATEKDNKTVIIATEKDNKTVIIATEEDTEDIKKNATIYIECASSIKEAKDKLAEKKYEIVLLDYLLGKKLIDGKTVTINNKEVREYGYELLKGIWAKEENKAEDVKYKDYIFDYKKGPDNRFYFMFISAFTTAVSERLLTEGWLRSEDYWYIGEGACPINTPYLFQYRLLHIMEKRMKDMGLAKWNVKEQETKDDSAKNKQDQPSNETDIYTELINEIYTGDGVRKRANEKFQDVLDLLYHYKNLLLDTDMPSDNVFDSAESVLATDFVMNHMDYEGVLEHLTQLVYLTAFGTVRQWPEMWEEYQYIKSYLGRIQCVEDFIVNLKNNSIK